MRCWIFTASVFATVLSLAGSLSAAERPNILFIFTDDHASHSISAYGSRINKTPNLDRIANEGMLFENCFCTNSICGPSRAVILTGRHSHLNGFLQNGNKFDATQQVFPKLLQKVGYQTAIIGKWHLGHGGKSDPQGFDYWEVLHGQGPYYNPPMIKNGDRVKHTGYTTDIITDQSLKWLKDRDQTRPFFLMCQHKAPHGRWEPALRHLDTFEGMSVPEPATLFDDYSGRSAAASGHAMGIADDLGPSRLMFRYSSKLTPEQFREFDGYFRPRNEAIEKANLTGVERTRWNYQRYIKNYLRCVKAVDENIGRMLRYLDEAGLAENTVVIYSSDQGFYLGEHGWFDKRWMYEESLHTPLLVRWPGVTTPGTRNGDLVSNLDFAETFLDIAGATIPDDMQGGSLVPFLRGRRPDGWRQAHYYHYYEAGGHGVPIHYGVTDGRYKLIRFPDESLDTWEFFDLQRDPKERTSQYRNPDFARQVAAKKAELKRLRRHYRITEERSH